MVDGFVEVVVVVDVVVPVRSDESKSDGSGLSGEVCVWTAFQVLPTRRKTTVKRPVAVSDVPR